MGMTIDEALNLLNNSKPKSNNAFSIQMNEAINVIGGTIHKYQQIQEIVKNTQLLCSYGSAFIDIRMIVEEIQKITLSLPEDIAYYESLKNNKQYRQVSEIHNTLEHTIIFEKTLGTNNPTENR